MRLFLALSLPHQIQQEITARLEMGRRLQGVRWLGSDGWHLTLKFLGETDPHLLEEIKKKVQEGLQGQSALNLWLEGAGVFPTTKKPRVFWLSAKGDTARLKNLASDLEDALSRLGFLKEMREFHPHLTLARAQEKQLHRPTTGVTASEEFCTLFSNFKSTEFLVKEIRLFQSRLTPDGAVYEPMESFSLEES